MVISQVGINLIKKWEGVRLTAYPDVVGVWTIGYGHTKGVYAGMNITQTQAEAFLKEDIISHVAYLKKVVKVVLTQNQFDALASFHFNLGAYVLQNDTTLLEYINNSKWQQVGNQMKKYVYAGGQEVQGLKNRRNDEVELFMANERSAIVSEARKHLGKPYSQGAGRLGPNVFDCSGLVYYVFLTATGKQLGTVTWTQDRSGERISVNEALPGDLYFWGVQGNTSHVAIAIGNGDFIHSPQENEVVKITNVKYFPPSFALRMDLKEGPTIPLWNITKGTKVQIQPKASKYLSGASIDPSEKHGPQNIISDAKFVNQSNSKRAYYLTPLNQWLLEEDVTQVLSNSGNGSKNLYQNLKVGDIFQLIWKEAKFCGSNDAIPQEYKLKQYEVEEVVWAMDWMNAGLNRRACKIKGIDKWVFERDVTLNLSGAESLYQNVSKGTKIKIIQNASKFCGNNLVIPESFKENKMFEVEEAAWAMHWIGAGVNARAYKLKSLELWVFEGDITQNVTGCFPTFNGSIYASLDIGNKIKVNENATHFLGGKQIIPSMKNIEYLVVEAKRLPLTSISLRAYRVMGLGDNWVLEQDVAKTGEVPTYYGSIFSPKDIGSTVKIRSQANYFYGGGVISNEVKDKPYKIKNAQFLPSINLYSWRAYELIGLDGAWVLEHDLIE